MISWIFEAVLALSAVLSSCPIFETSRFLNFSRVGFGSFDATKELCIFSAGAIFVWNNFTQSSGTLTITNASAEKSGGVVDLGAPQRGDFGDVV